MFDIFNLDFRSKNIRDLFDKNYFICLYDKQDNYITSFENLTQASNFLNTKVKFILYYLRNNLGIEYNNHRYKLFCYKKDDEIDYIESRGRSL